MFNLSFTAEFSGHCILSGETQRRALYCYQSEKIKILNNLLPRFESTAVASQQSHAMSVPHYGNLMRFYYSFHLKKTVVDAPAASPIFIIIPLFFHKKK